NDRRTVVRTTAILNTSGGMAPLEMMHREARGTDLRHPHLAAAASDRLAIFWTELRDERIVPVASVSIDGGSSWSRPLVLDATHRGDSDRVRGGFDRGSNLVAVYLTWPGRTSLRTTTGIGLKAAEVPLRGSESLPPRPEVPCPSVSSFIHPARRIFSRAFRATTRVFCITGRS